MSDSGRSDLLLEVRNLQVHFYLFEGVVQAVNDVSFDVHRGRTWASSARADPASPCRPSR